MVIDLGSVCPGTKRLLWQRRIRPKGIFWAPLPLVPAGWINTSDLQILHARAWSCSSASHLVHPVNSYLQNMCDNWTVRQIPFRMHIPCLPASVCSSASQSWPESRMDGSPAFHVPSVRSRDGGGASDPCRVYGLNLLLRVLLQHWSIALTINRMWQQRMTRRSARAESLSGFTFAFNFFRLFVVDVHNLAIRTSKGPRSETGKGNFLFLA